MAEVKKELQTTGTTNYPDKKKLGGMLLVENMTKLKKKYDPKLIPEAKEKGDEGYLVVHSMAMDIVKVRTNIEARRKEVKKDALDFGRLVDSKAKELIEQVEALEEPWKKLKSDLDEKEAREAEEARKIEAEKIAAIEAKINVIKSAAANLSGADLSVIKNTLQLLEDTIIDDSFGDYVEVAEHYKDESVATLKAFISERETFLEQQAQVKADQEKLAAEQKIIDDKNAETRRKLDEQQAEIAEQQAEAQRKLDEQQAAIDKQKAEQEKAEAAEKQRKEDEELAELEEKQRKEKEASDAEAKKTRDAELYKRLPEDVKMRKYADELLAIEAPSVESKEMDQLNVDTALALGHLAADIYNRTQG